MPPTIDLLQCSASELSSYLYEHRFQNDGMATTAFLLEGTSTLPDAEAIAAQIQGEHEQSSPTKETKPSAAVLVTSQSEESISNFGDAKHSQPIELSLTNPRGKFNVTLHEHGIQFCTVKNPQYLSLPAGCVQSAIVFPKPTDCQTTTKKADAPTPSPIMLLIFDNNKLPSFKGKPVNQICFPVPASLDNLELPSDDITNVVEAWIQVLCDSLELNVQKSVFRIHNPADPASASLPDWKFKSHQEAGMSTTSDGMPFVKCYHGVQDGCLYPMKEGILFFKPPLFVPRSNLHSIACGRGSGASSRYVDMNIVTNDEVTMEFTNINRAEIGVLNDYIHKVLIPAMEQDHQEEGEEDATAEVAAMVVETGENEEDVVEVQVSAGGQDESDGSDSVEVVGMTPGRGCRSKRRAAQEAIQTTKQHYLKRQAANDGDEDDEDEDSEDDAPYQFQQEPASDDEGGDSSGEEEVAEGDDDEDEEESDGDAEVVAEEDDDETEDDEDEQKAPPKKKRRGKR